MGRRTNTVRDQRKCICGTSVEDENHFLVDGNIYHDIRQSYGIDNPNIADILDCPDYANYICDLYERRKDVKYTPR